MFRSLDFVRETSETTGTGAYALSGTVDESQPFAVVGDGNTFDYAARNGTDFETGLGRYDAASNIVVRVAIYESSNSNVEVNWGPGTKTLTNTFTARRATYPMQKQSVDSVESVLVPSGYSMVVVGPFSVDGDITIDGDLVVI